MLRAPSRHSAFLRLSARPGPIVGQRATRSWCTKLRRSNCESVRGQGYVIGIKIAAGHRDDRDGSPTSVVVGVSREITSTRQTEEETEKARTRDLPRLAIPARVSRSPLRLFVLFPLLRCLRAGNRTGTRRYATVGTGKEFFQGKERMSVS